MIRASIESLVIGILPCPSVITLRQAESQMPHKAVDDDLVLSIIVGPSESSAIVAALEEGETERPLTHKLTCDLVSAMGGSISRVVIDRVDGPTFFCTVYLRLSNGMFTRVDARPSDGIALAIRSGAPLFVEEDVFERAGTPRSFATGDDTAVEIEEFDKFIEQVSPEDFATHLGPSES